jgi:hypothetical protein
MVLLCISNGKVVTNTQVFNWPLQFSLFEFNCFSGETKKIKKSAADAVWDETISFPVTITQEKDVRVLLYLQNIFALYDINATSVASFIQQEEHRCLVARGCKLSLSFLSLTHRLLLLDCRWQESESKEDREAEGEPRGVHQGRRRLHGLSAPHSP